ncbi:MAG: hypothetical protein K8R88_13370, partial [Armatimonadetes bacterium]|nr:hypothetical protein [Armatimonadota bacterium]
ALPAALIRVYRGGHEVITTIMMNNIVKLFTAALVAGPFKSALVQDPRTANLTPNTMLPAIYKNGPLEIFPSLLIGVVMIVAFSYWMKRSVGGFELNAVGANRVAATFAGIDAKRVMMRAFLSSGTLGGLAGALMVLAHEGCFYDGFSPGYGFDSLGVALLSGGTPIGLLPAGLAFGLLNQGQSALSILGISKGLTSVLLGCLIIVLAAYRYRPVKVVTNG